MLQPRRGLRRTASVIAGALIVCAAALAGAVDRPHMHHPRRGCQIPVGPVVVPQGQELTECTYLKLPSRRDLNVNRVKIKVSGGSHHVHIYRPHDPTLDIPDHAEACNFALDFSVFQLVLASQQRLLDWKLPNGIAFHFRAGEQLVAQTHFIDSGPLQTVGPGWAIFNLYSVPKRKVTSYAGALFGQDRDVVVPPHSVSTATTRCLFPKPVKLLALTGHYHFRGTSFTAATWDGTGGEEIYRQEGYYDPPFERFGEDAPLIPGIQWTCTYQNTTDETFTFGPFTDKNEHCNLFAFYYPTATPDEFMTCVQKNQVVTVNVQGQ